MFKSSSNLATTLDLDFLNLPVFSVYNTYNSCECYLLKQKFSYLSLIHKKYTEYNTIYGRYFSLKYLGTGVPSSGNLSGQRLRCPTPLIEICIALIRMIKTVKF